MTALPTGGSGTAGTCATATQARLLPAGRQSLGDPDLRHFNVTQGHATSRDLKVWDYRGTSFAPAQGPAWDDHTTRTGSVVKGDDGLWHLFYTGAKPGRDGLKQRIGRDEHQPARLAAGGRRPCSSTTATRAHPGHWHDRAMRDPRVMRDPTGGWMMFFTARVPGVRNRTPAAPSASPPRRTSTAGRCRRRSTPAGPSEQMEVPQVFRAGGRWYCLFYRGKHYSLCPCGRLSKAGRCRGPALHDHLPDPRGAVGNGAGAVPRRRPGRPSLTRRGSSTPTPASAARLPF